MKNEFGEQVSEEEIVAFSNRIRALSINAIDSLWHLCNWCDETKEDDNKALPQSRILSIKQNNSEAIRQTKNLLTETPVKQFLEALKSLE